MSTAESKTVARGTLLSIGLRLLSFVLSQLTVRFVSAGVLGQASIPLELLLSTALFVGREGFRLALTKAEVRNGDPRDARITNVSWLTVPVGALLAVVAAFVHLHQCGQNEDTTLDYKLAGMLYCLAAFVESLAEPLVIQCLQQLDVATKAKAEGSALVMKSVSCFACLRITQSSWFRSVPMFSRVQEKTSFAVTSFGVSQLAYSIVFSGLMYRKRWTRGIYWPCDVARTHNNHPYRTKLFQNFDVQTLRLVLIFSLQGLFKHALTEGDKIVLSALAGSYDQGVYALAASYGGLAARLLLQPMEENARLLFSHKRASVVREMKNVDDEGKDPSTSLRNLEDSYCFLVRCATYIGLVFAGIATNYTPILLRILAGRRWGASPEASEALSAFCVYTAFLALNGMTEAFVYGVSTSGKDVTQLGIAHAVVGGMFAVVAPGLVAERGAVGLVAANCVSMACRSLYSIHFATDFFAKATRRERRSNFELISKLLPRTAILLAFALSYALTNVARVRIYEEGIVSGKNVVVVCIYHIGVGILCLILCSVSIFMLDREVKDSLVSAAKRKQE